jgi:ribosomal protein L19E
MTKSSLPRSLRKYIRKEKARIRRQFLDLAKQKEMINNLYQKVYSLIKSKNEFDNKKVLKQRSNKETAFSLK